MSPDTDIATLDIKQLWNILKNDKNSFEKGDVDIVYSHVKYGIRTMFHIEKFLNNMYIEKQKANMIQIDGKVCKYEDVFDELEERQRELYELILLNNESLSIYGGRK